MEAGLLSVSGSERRVNRSALLEFLAHGLSTYSPRLEARVVAFDTLFRLICGSDRNRDAGILEFGSRLTKCNRNLDSAPVAAALKRRQASQPADQSGSDLVKLNLIRQSAQ